MKWKAAIAACIATIAINSTSPSVDAAFTDVPTSQWYAKSIEKLAKYDIITGYEDGSFKPQSYVTRAQAATILANALRLKTTNTPAPSYRDVSATNGHYGAIAALTNKGVFQNGHHFYPNKPLTRQQMAKLLVTAFHLKSSGIVTFTDVPAKSWSYRYIGTLGALGITTTQGDFSPNAPITRAQLAAFIERTIDYKRRDNEQDIWDTWKNWS